MIEKLNNKREEIIVSYKPSYPGLGDGGTFLAQSFNHTPSSDDVLFPDHVVPLHVGECHLT